MGKNKSIANKAEVWKQGFNIGTYTIRSLPETENANAPNNLPLENEYLSSAGVFLYWSYVCYCLYFGQTECCFFLTEFYFLQYFIFE
jgi:hypothetical protein